jgi:hypothetical protein
VPALVANAGDQASWRNIEFFAANLNNANTRRAYARAPAPDFSPGVRIAGLRSATSDRSTSPRGSTSNGRR